MYFDTHCHLNFSRFKNTLDDVIKRAFDAHITHIVIPGTNEETSRKAVEIAQKTEGLYAAVGIHPHHIYDLKIRLGEADPTEQDLKSELNSIISLLNDKKVVAIGEVGADRHVYGQTKYEAYTVDERFLSLQLSLLKHQIKTAIEYNKSLILHNREAKADLLKIVHEVWDSSLRWRTVLHCCEPDPELLTFAQEHEIFIGVDGDVTYDKIKASFVKLIPTHMLVLETDSPFLLPEPLRTEKKFPNEPANIPLIARYIADQRGEPVEKLAAYTTENAKRLFDI